MRAAVFHDRLPAADDKKRVRWYLNRLRCMRPAEIPYRIGRTVAAHAERWALWDDDDAPPADLSPLVRPWIHASPGVDAAPYVVAANRIVAGKLDVFALHEVDLGMPLRWNRDPKTGTEAPLSFGKLLDYRDPELVGDIKYLWEPNRHMHLVTLAQAFALSGDARYVRTLRRHLESWFTACPYRMGPNWASTLEPAIRLINWSAAWHLLGGADGALFDDVAGERFRERWLQSIHRHARFIRGHFSRHSSANNHLIGEAAGLYVAARTWPYWLEAQAWLAEAAAILEREVLLQNAPDGVNREQAVSYQQFELDLLLLALLAAKADGAHFSAAFTARIEAMLEYIASIMDVAGNVPMFGDSDDGLVVKLSQEPDFCRYRSVLATGALLFERADFAAKAGWLDDKTRWLCGTRAADEFAERRSRTPRAAPTRRAFPDGGYYMLGCDFESQAEIRLVADAGPLGYNTIAAHGHADALAFTLSVGGREIFVDPGTYDYRPDGPWRAYFRSTAAHNTVRIDALDQSVPGGNFMWLHKANAGCSFWRSAAGADVFEGWHDGYTRLPDPVMHRRRITLDKKTRCIAIDDTLEMEGAHDVEIYFHCSEQCRVDPTPDGYAIRDGTRTVSLKLPRAGHARATVHHGDLAPIAGWISRRFDVKEPCPTIAWRARLAGKTVLRSELILI